MVSGYWFVPPVVAPAASALAWPCATASGAAAPGDRELAALHRGAGCRGSFSPFLPLDDGGPQLEREKQNIWVNRTSYNRSRVGDKAGARKDSAAAGKGKGDGNGDGSFDDPSIVYQSFIFPNFVTGPVTKFEKIND